MYKINKIFQAKQLELKLKSDGKLPNNKSKGNKNKEEKNKKENFREFRNRLKYIEEENETAPKTRNTTVSSEINTKIQRKRLGLDK